MKVCSYCGTENPNNAAICENCGAHEFKHKCNNCGTIFSDGEFCPKCGVKAGQRPRVCPNCGSEYYSNACPTCGYVKGKNGKETGKTSKATARSVSQPQKPARKRNTWLWVLGWIFIFPLPLTILLLRNQKMNKVIKILIIAIAWIFYSLFVFAGQSSDSGETGHLSESTNVTGSEQVVSGNSQGSETGGNLTETDDSSLYAEDIVVNRFITEFNNTYDDDIVEISKGNIRTKYFGKIRDTRIEMINANDAGAKAFSVTIYGGREVSDRDAMFAAFKEVVKILEPLLSDDAITGAIDELIAGDSLTENYQLGSTMLVTYVPTKELSSGKNACRVDILAYDYKETPSEASVVEFGPIEMDVLQKLFASLSSSTTREEIDKYIVENSLEKFAFTHDSAYQIGYEYSAIRQRGRDRVGPAVDVNFVTSGDADKIGTVKSAEYAVHTEASTHYSLRFEDGIFYYEGEACASGEEAMQKYLAEN